MRRLSVVVPVVTLRQIYFSMFQSLLCYGITVWGGCGVVSKAKLVRLQNRALDMISAVPPDLRQPLSFQDLYNSAISNQSHKYLHIDNFSPYFNIKINSLIPSHSHQTRFRNYENILLPIVRKTVTQEQFLFKAIKCWNKLPQELKNILCTKKFKLAFKKWLYSSR